MKIKNVEIRRTSKWDNEMMPLYGVATFQTDNGANIEVPLSEATINLMVQSIESDLMATLGIACGSASTACQPDLLLTHSETN